VTSYNSILISKAGTGDRWPLSYSPLLTTISRAGDRSYISANELG
jgi:hypothetical protein